MSLQVERLEHNMAKLTIEVPAEEVEKALQAAYLKERGKISLPGFRIVLPIHQPRLVHASNSTLC